MLLHSKLITIIAVFYFVFGGYAQSTQCDTILFINGEFKSVTIQSQHDRKIWFTEQNDPTLKWQKYKLGYNPGNLCNKPIINDYAPAQSYDSIRFKDGITIPVTFKKVYLNKYTSGLSSYTYVVKDDSLKTNKIKRSDADTIIFNQYFSLDGFSGWIYRGYMLEEEAIAIWTKARANLLLSKISVLTGLGLGIAAVFHSYYKIGKVYPVAVGITMLGASIPAPFFWLRGLQHKKKVKSILNKRF